MLTHEQANIIYDSFYHGLDVHFNVDGNDYYLFSPKTSQITEKGKLQVNSEMDFDIDAVRLVGANGGSLVLSMSGGNSGFVFTLAAEQPKPKIDALYDYDDGEEADE